MDFHISSPVWADIDEENNVILVNTSEHTVTKRNISRNSKVALCIVDQYNPCFLFPWLLS